MAAAGVPLRTLQEWMATATSALGDYAPSPQEHPLIESASKT
jgi:hypothetical protein